MYVGGSWWILGRISGFDPGVIRAHGCIQSLESVMSPAVTRFIAILITLCASALGGLAFHLLGLPAPWLSGGVLAVAVLALKRWGGPVPRPLFNASMILLGASMGVSVTPETVSRIGTWPGSMVGLGVSVAGIIGISFYFLRRVAKWDVPTALFASMPGAFSMVLLMAGEARASVPRVVVAQMMRVFTLVALVPIFITGMGHMDPIARVSHDGTLFDYALLGGLCIAASWAADRLRVPAGMLLGAFIVSALLHLTEISTITLPQPVMIAGFIVLGASIGRRFANIEPRSIVTWLWPSLGAFAGAAAVSGFSAFAVSYLFDIPFPQVLIAYLPGALEAMILMAFALGIDPAFVAAHQLARFIVLTMLVPFLVRKPTEK